MTKMELVVLGEKAPGSGATLLLPPSNRAIVPPANVRALRRCGTARNELRSVRAEEHVEQGHTANGHIGA